MITIIELTIIKENEEVHMNKKILKLITISSSALMLTAPLAMSSTVQPTTVQAASKQTKKSVSMLVYKYSKNHKSRAKSMARGFVGTKATVKVKSGKVQQLIVHVDGSKTPMGKGQDVAKIVRTLKINGVKAKKTNISKDKSKFDFVFSSKAFKNNGWAKMSVTINFGGNMTEAAWVKFGKVSGLKTSSKKTAKKATKKTKKSTKKTSSKSKKVSKKSSK